MNSLHLTILSEHNPRHVTAPGEAVGGSVPSQGHLSRGIEGGYSPPHQQSLPDLRFEPTTFRLQVRYPLGHDCPTR